LHILFLKYILQGMIEREFSKKLLDNWRNYPIVCILGPRQCGKTTLAKMVFPALPYFDLERPSHAAPFLADPESRLENLGPGIILDEAQQIPELFPVLRSMVDEKRKKNGQYLLLGSASPSLTKNISQSLAGRVSFLEISPLTIREINHTRKNKFDLWIHGGFPQQWLMKKNDQKWEWKENFVQTYIQRDLNVLGIQIDSGQMRKLWSMLAHLNGSYWNASQVAGSMGVSQTMVNRYLSILEETFLMTRLPPFHANIGKRFKKSAKIYFKDTGLLHYFLQIQNFEQLDISPYKGRSFEAYVIQQIRQFYLLHYPGTEIFHWRSAGGAEVDLILKLKGKIIPFEIKLSKSPEKKTAIGLRSFIKDLNLKKGFIIYPGIDSYSLGEGVFTLPVDNFLKDPSSFLGL
jgi:predicted AAA+ superfamily ATPase